MALMLIQDGGLVPLAFREKCRAALLFSAAPLFRWPGLEELEGWEWFVRGAVPLPTHVLTWIIMVYRQSYCTIPDSSYTTVLVEHSKSYMHKLILACLPYYHLPSWISIRDKYCMATLSIHAWSGSKQVLKGAGYSRHDAYASTLSTQ